MSIANGVVIKDWGRSGLGVPLVLLLLLAMMVLPIPPFFLDLFFTFNISLSILVLLAGVYALRPLDFAVFPTVLLLTTLLRLALNVASTRVVLLYGHQGEHAAGEVIRAFGEVVIGGNFAVGLVVFSILIIINFVVITKGAGRISEVTARFTLDAMPGKQMAIDADLSAGLINQEEAKHRRTEVGREADFYGSMDGASKFIRGDAIAGILILFINLVGGTVIGILQHDLSFKEALEIYALLTIGDGLVAQIPALILSTASAIMVTRVSSASDVSKDVYAQMFSNPKPVFVAGGILSGLGLIPGMPHGVFLLLGSGLMGLAHWLNQRGRAAEQVIAKEKEEITPQATQSPLPAEAKELSWEDVPPVDLIGLEIGYRLIHLVDKGLAGELIPRIRGIRKKLSQELGFLIPSVHIRDNLDLPPNIYRICVLGVVAGEAEIFVEKELAISAGQFLSPLKGLKVKDPAFGLEAYWIDPVERNNAQALGYTVVDASTVIATHLSQILQNYAGQLLGHEEAQQLLDNLSKTMPKLVENLTPKTIPMNVIVRVLQNLLAEKVSIKDVRTIAETLLEFGPKTADPFELTAQVRIRLGRLIVQQIAGNKQEMAVFTLTPSLEQILQKSLQSNKGEPLLVLEPNLMKKMTDTLKNVYAKQEVSGEPLVVLVPVHLRWAFSALVRSIPLSIFVLAYAEIPSDRKMRIAGLLGENS